jgi:hypothetical protein
LEDEMNKNDELYEKAMDAIENLAHEHSIETDLRIETLEKLIEEISWMIRDLEEFKRRS